MSSPQTRRWSAESWHPSDAPIARAAAARRGRRAAMVLAVLICAAAYVGTPERALSLWGMAVAVFA